MTRWSSADLNRKAKPEKKPVAPPKVLGQATTPPEGQAFNQPPPKREKKGQVTPTELRPRYQVAKTEEYDGKKVVFVGLSEEMVQRLSTYAQTLGIQQQN